MKRFLLALIITSAVIPSGALLVVGHAQFVEQRERISSGVPGLVVDRPGTAEGADLLPVATEELEELRGISWTSELLTQPAMIESEQGRRIVQLMGVEPNERRLARLATIRSAGQVENLDSLGIALGDTVASSLGIELGDEVRALGLDPGPQALGFRKRTFQVVALLHSGMTRFDESAAVTTLDAARTLRGRARAVTGLEAWFDSPLPPILAREQAALKTLPDHRARYREQRDWPRVDRVAGVGLARSTLVVAFLIAFLAASLCGVTDRTSYLQYLARYAPAAGLSLTLALLASVGTAALALEPHLAIPLEVRRDLGRLFLAISMGLLLSPLLFGRMRGLVSLVVLSVVVTFATSEPAANGLAASASTRNAVRLTDAARSASSLVDRGSLPAVLWSGSEVVPIDLVGLDPERPQVEKLLRVLTEGADVSLRPEGVKRPPPWRAGGGSFGDLLDLLATKGTAAENRERNPDGVAPEKGIPPAPPPLVIGKLVARQLGVSEGELVQLTAVPPGVSLAEDVIPHPPVTFRVAALARLGLTSVDRSLALADLWQVDAVGGAPGRGEGRGVAPAALQPRGDAVDAAAAPFARRARQVSIATALQISIVCLLLGGLASKAGRRPWELVVWLVAGTAVGAMVGYGEVMGGRVEIADRAIYEALPRAGGELLDLVGFWTIFPGVVALAAACTGFFWQRRTTGAEQRSD